MKYIRLIIAISLFSQITFGQELSGTYVSGNDLIDINKNNVKFEIISDGGLIWTLRGQGTYSFVGDFIVIKTDEFDGIKSTVHKECNGQFGLRVVDENSEPVHAVNVGFYYPTRMLVDGSVTDKSGYIENKTYKPAETIEVKFIGYDLISFNYSPDCYYSVILVEGNTLENSTVVFKIIKKTRNSLELVLLSTNFKYDSPTLRQLKKLYRKSRKYKYRERKFEN